MPTRSLLVAALLPDKNTTTDLKQLSVIIVNYNVCYFLEQALKSVQVASKGMNVEVIVVDNNSVDGSVAMVRKKFPEVVLIANEDNVGFSKANNQGIEIAQGEHVLLLNPDTVIEEQTLARCYEFMTDHPDAGGLGVKMLDGKGQFLPESKRGLPTPWIAFYKIFGLARLFPKSKKFGRYHLGFLDKDKTHEIEVLSGAFMLIRSSVLKEIGGLDEDYFMYGEDIDLSYRITKAGYKNYYLPETRIIHYKGESTKRTSVNYVFIFYKAMIIFARKHFSGKSARVFAFLINFAIYLRAGFEIFSNFIRKSIIPLTDAAVIYTGMYFLKDYWENNHKYVSEYPWQLMGIAVPLYILTWLISAYYSGGYDKPTRSSKIIRGIVIGTVLISAVTNFFPDYRFSRALIVLGGAWATFVLLFNRFIVHLIKYKNLNIGQEQTKRIAVVGSEVECKRVMGLINDLDENLKTIGWVSKDSETRTNGSYLGSVKQVNEIVEIYGVNEIIFCSKDIPTNRVIQLMTEVNQRFIDFKIVPDNSNYMIGSNSKLTTGEFYTVNIEMNLLHKNSRRSKRVLDFGISFLFILLSPILMWFTKNPITFLRNCFRVLGGKLTWVGFNNTEQINLPKIRKGVITPSSYIRKGDIDEHTEERLDMLYARDYTVLFDLNLLLKSFSKLGSSS